MATTKKTKSASKSASKATGKASASARKRASSAPVKGKRASTASAARGRKTAPKRAGVRSLTRAAPPHFIIFLPGWLGSRLNDPAGNTVWLDFGSVTNYPGPQEWFDDIFAKMRFPDPDPNAPLTPGSIMENLFGVLPVAQHYSRLKATFKSWGYQIDPPARANDDLSKLIFYTFPYDWRHSFRDAAQALKSKVDELRLRHPDRQVWLMGHSGGGIVSRWYLEKLGGNDVVSRLFLFASPWDGAPGALYHIINGYDKLFALPITLFNIPARTRETLRMFPSLYEIIPQARPFVYGADGASVSPFDDVDWLADDHDKEMLAAAREFNRELGNTTHIDTVAFIGYNKPTRSEGHMTAQGSGRWDNMQWKDTDFIGDGTVPLYSAEYANARRYYAIASHDDIYANDEIKSRLFYEISGKYRGASLAATAGEKRKTDAAVDLPPTATPGQEVHVTVMLTAKASDAKKAAPLSERKPVTAKKITAKLVWQHPLPLSKNKARPKKLPSVTLVPDAEVKGRYHGSFIAPAQPGHYEWETTVSVQNEPPIKLKDALVISAA